MAVGIESRHRLHEVQVQSLLIFRWRRSCTERMMPQAHRTRWGKGVRWRFWGRTRFSVAPHINPGFRLDPPQPLRPVAQGPRRWISIYFANREWLEPKVRILVDYLVAAFANSDLQRRVTHWLQSARVPG